MTEKDIELINDTFEEILDVIDILSIFKEVNTNE